MQLSPYWSSWPSSEILNFARTLCSAPWVTCCSSRRSASASADSSSLPPAQLAKRSRWPKRRSLGKPDIRLSAESTDTRQESAVASARMAEKEHGEDRAERLAELRYVFVDGPPVTEGYRGVDLLVEGDEVVIVFRWWQDSSTYAVRASLTEGDTEFFWDPQTWLMEELDTGLVRGGARRQVAGRVELSWPRPTQEHKRWYVAAVPLDAPDVRGIRVGGRWLVARRVLRPGNFLKRYGFDIATEAEAFRRQTLITWMTLWTNDTEPRALGHGSTLLPGPHAEPRLHLHPTADVNESAELDLISALLHGTAEAGFTRITAEIDRASLPHAGLERQPDGSWSIALNDLTRLDW